MAQINIPLFPLNRVLFPGGELPLRIFEPRYIDMVRDCMREDKGFGVVLIEQGSEVGEAAQTFRVGTLAKIVDFDQQPDGLLGILARGHERFQILSVEVLPNKLTMAVVDIWAPEAPERIPQDLHYLVELVKDIETRARVHVAEAACYADATWVGFKLAQLLPFNLAYRQSLLEVKEPLERLVMMADIIAKSKPGRR